MVRPIKEAGENVISLNVAVEDHYCRPQTDERNFHRNESKNWHAEDRPSKSVVELLPLASL